MAVTVHAGSLDRVGAAYSAIEEFAEAHGLRLADAMWERDLGDAGSGPDPGRQMTEVYWPLA